MNDNQLLRRCFVIGPMQDMARLHGLRDAIIRPLLEPHGFRVITPDEGDIGSIMNHVLLNLEQADLLIADLSGSNPNVMYELGIYHSFGKPYLVIKDTSYPVELDKTPFDIAAYRYVEINFNEPTAARAILKDRLDRIIGQLDTRDWFGNPVTDFYQSPVAEIPTAVGLSKNYTKNFLGQLLPEVFLRNENDDNYALEVWVQQPDQPKNDLRPLTEAERDALTFEILIPIKMQMAEHTFITDLKQSRSTFQYLQARVVRRTRPFNLHYRLAEDGHYILADVPTVLSTLNESIINRRIKHADLVDSEEWRILEAQELERFAGKCDLFTQNLLQRYPITRGRIRVEWRWNPLGE